MKTGSKDDQFRAALAAGDESRALGIVAKFKGRGAIAERIARGWAAHQRPDFYRELGQDPDALFADGVAALREKYEV